MPTLELSSIHDHLVEEEELLVEERRRLEAEAEIGEFATELIDRAEQVIRQQNAERQLERVHRRLEEVRAAQQRIHDGSFGICAVCGDRIEPPRLETVPTTVCCIRDAVELD